MFRSLALLPLLATLAVAQDRQVHVDVSGFRAEAYAVSLFGEPGMTSRLLAVYSAEAGPWVYTVVPDPGPECLLTVFVGAGEIDLNLAPFGIAGYLLVDPVYASLIVPLREPIRLPPAGALIGIDAYLQTVLVRFDPVTSEFRFSFSHGMKISYFAP